MVLYQTGRPPIYEHPEDMQNAIEGYFSLCKSEQVKLTVTGLALHLGFESRQSIYDYKEKGDFSYIIKRALMSVENGYELALHNNNVAGPIFALKNMGWKDKTEVEKTVNGSMVVNYVNQAGNAPLEDGDD